ncbi:MAG: hypothetical protein FJ144_12160 [Deltaproteobacteria bacterium]|nr:hypothetical protein [Deltaproteobacteria bacterium]
MHAPLTAFLVALFLSVPSVASCFALLEVDKEATFVSGPEGYARIRVGADRALQAPRDPRCPAVSRVRISSYRDSRFVGDAEAALPCESWTKTARGFVYRDSSGAVAGIRTVRFGPDGLQIEAAAPGHTPVTGPIGFAHVRFSVDDQQFFVRFHTFSRNGAAAVVSPRASRASAAAEAAFWDTMLGDVADSDGALTALARATSRNPYDGRAHFLTGMMRLYRFERMEPDQRRVSLAGKREILASTSAMERALPLRLGGLADDSRVPGFAGAAIYKKGVAFGESRTTERGRRMMEDAAEVDALFNGFIPFGFAPIAAPTSPDYATILHLLDDVFPTLFEECFMQPEICFNEGLAPHNLEGTFVLFGDLYTKAGRVEDAVSAYETAVGFGESSGWKPEFLERARQLVQEAPARAALYQDDDPANDPAFTDLGGAGNCAYCHNR